MGEPASDLDVTAPVDPGTPDTKEHRVVEAETLNYRTGSQRLTCLCGWQGHRNRWTGPDHGTDVPPLPPTPEPPQVSREALRAAIYGERRYRRR